MADPSARIRTRFLLPVALAVLASLTLGSSSCQPKPVLHIWSPENGGFYSPYPNGQIWISGYFKNIRVTNTTVLVDGAPATVYTDKNWETYSPMVPTKVFHSFVVELKDTFSEKRYVKKRVTAIVGESLAKNQFAGSSLALRLNDRGLNQIEPILPTLVGDAFDIGAFLQPGQDLGNGATLINASIGNFAINADSKPGYLEGTTTVYNLTLNVDVDTGFLGAHCGLYIHANSLALVGEYELVPAGSALDVNQLQDVTPVFGGFQHDFVSGICSAPLIEEIVNSIVGDLEAQFVSNLRSQLRDPDGGGPVDSPIAAGVQEGLSGIDIGGQVGALIGVNMETPGVTATLNNDGMTLVANSRITATAAQCTPPAGTPQLARSLKYNLAVPSLGANTPHGLPYGIGIALSPTAFNQLMRASIECGLLNMEIAEIALFPGAPPQTLTRELLASFDPAFAAFPPGTEFVIKIAPTLAPVITDGGGPSGELMEMRIGALRFDIVEANPTVFGTVLGVEVNLGMGMNLTANAGGIVPTISQPLLSDIQVMVVQNPLGMNEVFFEALLPYLMGPIFPSLADTLGSFPLPSFLGVNLSIVEVGMQGDFLAVFADFAQ